MTSLISRRSLLAGAGACATLVATGHAQPAAPALTLIQNVRIFDGNSPTLTDGSVLVEGSYIKSIERGQVSPPPGATVIDGGGRVLMPGLTDAHWHAAFTVGKFDTWGLSDPGLAYANMIAEAERTLMRGFTSVRDMCGPVFGLAMAIDGNKVPGPRIFPSGAMISQSAGHADFFPQHDMPKTLGGDGGHMEKMGLFAVANGVPEVLAAVRVQLKKGASQIKIAAGGGFGSDFDPIDGLQYSLDEQKAAVQAATDWGTYVAAHVYTSNGIRRAAEAGVRSIEHGHFADEATLKLMADKDMWLSIQAFGDGKPSPEADLAAMRKRKGLAMSGDDWLKALHRAKKMGTKVAFGTDVTIRPVDGSVQTEMLIRFALAHPAAEVLSLATARNGELFALAGNRNPYRGAKLGVIEKGAWADMLLVQGNPLEDIGILKDFDHKLLMIMKDGKQYKNILNKAPVEI